MTRRICSSLAAFAFIILLASWAESAEVVDACAAVVNQDVITVSEVEEAIRPFVERIKAEVPFSQRDEAMRQARRNVIDKLIEKHLMLQQAEQMKILVSAAEVEAARKDALERGGASEEEFKAELKKMGLTEQQYREKLKEQILSSKLVGYAVRSKVVVPEEKIRQYYENKYTAKASGYHLLQIGFAFGSSKQAARQKAEEVRQLVVSGQDFREIAKQRSELPSAADGGDIGVFKSEEMAPYMRNAVISLQPGGISPVVETQDSFMIFKLLASGQDAAKAPYESVRTDIHEILLKEEMETRYKAWLEEIRSGAYIRIL
ncbi:SurA N-terminal domain-containing protein [Candidatus Electronema sp. TJ]|uniref:SurA N-terminal domain-containing protein n=1 Tax=Candidatus Electronema sp. TJ TaxID=3401573 RepID=UPI003AA7DE49